MKDIFEYAVRNKLRFSSSKGQLSIEELWDVPLRSRDEFNLNVVAKTANAAVKVASEENFVSVGVKTPETTRREIALEVVKYVIAARIDEEAKAAKRAADKIEQEKLLAILAEKQDGQLSALSVKELQRRIAALGD